jgi:ABC-2 type transport system ATP-binding protein
VQHVARALGLVVACAAVTIAVGWNPAPPAASSTDLRVAMDDGVEIAGTLHLPDGTTPDGGWPGVVMLHGIGATRAQVATIAQTLQGRGYAVFAYDARGHGQSGGLFSGAGPREIADLNAVHAWLAARPDVSDSIGAWGISYGGGQILRALTEGAGFRAAVVAETWTDLYAALAPGGLAKSGLIFGFVNSVPSERRTPEVEAIATDAIASRNLDRLRAFADQRSSRARLFAVTAPVLVLQGRRDFAFGLDQGLTMLRGLGSDSLYIGPFGHQPSRFPGPDVDQVLSRTVAWFDAYVRRAAAPPRGPKVSLASDPYRASRIRGYASAPATTTLHYAAPGTSRIAFTAGFTRSLGRTTRVVETFGRPVVTLRASGTFPHVVAVLTARTPTGREITVSSGGTRVQLGGRARTITVRLTGQVTTIPRGSRLFLRIGSTSGDALYIVPGPTTSRLTAGRVTLALPVLRRPVSSP